LGKHGSSSIFLGFPSKSRRQRGLGAIASFDTGGKIDRMSRQRRRRFWPFAADL